MNRLTVLLAALLIPAAQLLAADKLVAVLDARPAAAASPAPVVHWREVRKEPRALTICCVRADLTAKDIEAVALIPPDPDGPGPAEATFEKPPVLAARPGVLAAVNANFFDTVTPPATPGQPAPKPSRGVGGLAGIRGWAKDETREASPPQDGYASFWVDAAGRGHIGVPAPKPEARMAVSGRYELLRDGKPMTTDLKPVHPRTAVGLDAEGKTLWLVVVDGRQAGYSEGMALGELAALMLELGCFSALNLDGGGSASMLVATDGEKLSVVSRPSDGSPRPVPVMLGIRSSRPRDTR